MRNILYWTATGLVALALASGGAAELLHAPASVEGIRRLGYPDYFNTILGAWKVLGAAALLAPRVPRLKEWAYAGAFFDLTGAAVSQIVRGDSVGHTLAPSLLAIVAVASWLLRPADRVLGPIAPGSVTFAPAASSK